MTGSRWCSRGGRGLRLAPRLVRGRQAGSGMVLSTRRTTQWRARRKMTRRGTAPALDADEGVAADLQEEHLEDKPAHMVLFEELQRERAELKQLRRQWPEDHWAVVTAMDRVAAAEDAWKSEKPAPLPSRALVRAEQAVRKGEGRVAAIVTKIQELDAHYERVRDELEEDLAGERQKLRDCRAALKQAQEQVGAQGRSQAEETAQRPSGGGEAWEQSGQVVQDAVSSLGEEVAPELTALVAQLEATGAGEDVTQKAQHLMAKLSAVHSGLYQLAQGQRRHQQYDLADCESLPELSDQERQQMQSWDEEWYYQDRRWQPWEDRWTSPQTEWRGGWADPQLGHGPAWQQHHHGGSWAEGGGGSWPQEPPNKRGKVEGGAMEVEEESPAQAAAAAAAGANEGAEAAAGALQRTRVAEFRAAAASRGVDISDLDLDNITVEQLAAAAAARLPDPASGA